MLHRSVYETFLRIVFVSCFPSDWEAILYDKKGRRSFSVTNFCRDDLKVDWVFLYHLMCKITHSKIHRHLPLINKIARGEKHGEITLEYSYDPKYIWLPINTSVFLLFALISIADELFLVDLQAAGAKSNDVNRFRDARAVLRHHISENKKEKFRQLIPDVEKIQKIIAAANSGKDWKILFSISPRLTIGYSRPRLRVGGIPIGAAAEPRR